MFKNVLTKGMVLYGTSLGTVVSVMAAPGDESATKSAFGLDKAPTKLGAVNSNQNLGQIVMGLLQNLLMLLGIVAVLIIIFAGVQLIMSQGNEEALKKAKKTLMMAAAGFALIVLSWAIVGFIISALSGGNVASQFQ